MIELQAITIKRGGRTLIGDVSATFRRGVVAAILGPNGAGKSTLIKGLTGEWPPSSGRVLFDNEDISRVPAARLAGRRAVVSQSTSLSFPFKVIEVVMLGMTVPGFGLPSDTRLALDALSAVGLDDFADRNYTQLSGGERQRVHIARAVCQLEAGRSQASGPSALILDEPTSNLDFAHQALVLKMLREQAAGGRAVVVVLHDLNLAATWADEVVLMTRGCIYAKGQPQDVFTDETLSAAYGCVIRANAVPTDGRTFVLPHHSRPDRHDRAGSSV
jgi:iron complex transport system ATP-binding protein